MSFCGEHFLNENVQPVLKTKKINRSKLTEKLGCFVKKTKQNKTKTILKKGKEVINLMESS